ncbi:LysE family translocator [Martelella limonii]|uniref:LysE family translocator n=1 Tax=Martelella limonii TaxID=1647649 RepID=UPI00158096FA|nr:LysE family translocator [Martelella limonii]
MLWDYLPQFMLAWSIQLVGVVSPGPSVMLILGVAMERGRGSALGTAFGVACGSMTLSIATVLGLSIVFAKLAYAMEIVRFLGAGYLFFLALKSFAKVVNPPPLKAAASAPGSLRRQAAAGYILQVSNPKAILFWLAIAGVGGVGDAPAAIIPVFVLGSFLLSFAGHGAYALLLSSGVVRAGLTRFRRVVEATLGGFFIFAGVKLLTAKV